MKIAVYSPYLDTFGGGENYMMAIAETLVGQHEVKVLLDGHLQTLGGDYLKDELAKRFNLKLDAVEFIPAPIGKDSSFLSRIFFLKNYDVLFYLTDGSIFYSTAKRNFLHIQSPLAGQPAKSIWGKVKLQGWDKILYNSKFTSDHSQKNWPIRSEIIYPPVDVEKIKPLEKKKYILSVGRFFGYLEDKKHRLLIITFKKLLKSENMNSWSLYLVGSASSGDRQYLAELQKLAEGLPVKFYPNLEYDKLVRLYGQSSIYWHAAGFSEIDPTKMEHFGISVVEAMSAGCVPVVLGKGGLKEIVTDGQSGFLWETLEQLEHFTIKIANDSHLIKNLSKAAKLQALKFDKKNFIKNIRQLVINE